MIRFSCDMGKRDIDSREDLRYVVKVEIFAAFEPLAIEEDDCDHLQEIQEILERSEDVESDQIGDDVYQQLRFDLCPECRRRFLKNPFGRESTTMLHFSEN